MENVSFGKRVLAHMRHSSAVETPYSDHLCPGQIDHYKMIIITDSFYFCLFLMQITI